MTSSESGATKRSLELSNEDEKSASSSKKVKVEGVENEACEKSQLPQQELLKMESVVPEGKIAKKTSGKGSTPNVLKRSVDPFSQTSSTFLSPSKKKKTSQNLGELDKDTDKHRYKEELEKKRKRLKKKALLKTVAEQMEFYFSDSNLRKDRFLKKMYDSSGDGLFNKFNKLQSLHKDGIRSDILCKALASSKVLEVNDERTKVRRRAPLVELDQEEVDRRTVYVEHLPVHASHAWIRKIFSPCGKVCYVSLPTYRTSKEMKGFAFVEFTSSEEAEKACTMLNNPPPVKTEEKPGKFPKGNKTLNRLQKIAPPPLPGKGDDQTNNEETVLSDSKEEQTTPIKKKKKKSIRRKSDENVEKNPTTEQNETKDDRKKKKKKKKQTTVAEGGDRTEKEASKISKSEEDTSCLRNSKEHQFILTESDVELEFKTDDGNVKKKKKKKKRRKAEKAITGSKVTDAISDPDVMDTNVVKKSEGTSTDIELKENQDGKTEMISEIKDNGEVKLSRKERKLLRQEDIRRKKAERESQAMEEMKEQNLSEPKQSVSESETELEVQRKRLESFNSESSETDGSSRLHTKRDGSQLTSCLAKSKKQVVVKKVEFDPVPITTEFVERKEVRRRKKSKRESLHLRVLSKKEWLSLRAEYIMHQKCHMAALKESLRELRMQEMANQVHGEDGKKHVDLTDVFGTKRMKPSQDVKLAHLEELKFIPNVIVQWKCSHEINRNKIKTMFSEISSDKIAYIEGKEEAKSGYIRFKDEASAEEFARLSRNSDSFSARVLPESQQASYWEKANRDRTAKLSRKKNERGSDKIARKVFERNKVTFKEKGTHVFFGNDDDDDDDDDDDNDNGEDGDNDESDAKICQPIADLSDAGEGE